MTDKQAVGQPCQCHLCGWRWGIIREVPTTGGHAGDVRVDIPVLGLVWVPAFDVNEVGDTCYHGPKLEQMVRERAEAKREEQEAAERKRQKLSARLFRRGD